MQNTKQVDLQTLLQRTLQGEDMQKLLSHPEFPKGDADITKAFETIATKLAAGPGYVGMGGYSSRGAGIRKQYIEDTISELEGGGTSEDTDPTSQLSPAAQQAIGALRFAQQQEEHEIAKKAAALEAKKPSAIGMILEMVDRQITKPAAKNLGEFTSTIKNAISGEDDPMNQFRLSPPKSPK